MSKIDDGGPAFPLATSCGSNITVNGMTLRDWFAAHASEKDIAYYLPNSSDAGRDTVRTYARYRFADAMLAARKGGGA